MTRKTISGIVLTLLLVGMVTLTFNVQPVEASETIYIRADGSVEGTTHISSVDNITYTFTDNIYDEIVVERNNIVIDGAGYTLQGTGAWDSKGISLSGRSNVTIKNTEIKSFWHGILFDSSSNNTVSGNSITNNDDGIRLSNSSDNTISGNNITANEWDGIWLAHSANYNTICGNSITNNDDGICVPFGVPPSPSSNNIITGNSVTNNSMGFQLYQFSNNTISGNNITNNEHGIWLTHSANYNTICGNSITNNDDGIRVYWSSDYNMISGNSITNNDDGIRLSNSSDNTISGNNITNNEHGIWLTVSSNYNSVSGNKITNNWGGIRLYDSSDNKFHHNDFVDNTQQIYNYENASTNVWDDGYPSGGNYWSDYGGSDSYSGPYQNLTGSDGIGDTAHVIDENNQDNYPLMNPYVPLFCDLNDDGKVDISDVLAAAMAFGSHPGHPRWNPAADLNGDSQVRVDDILTIALNFGKTR